MQLLPLHQNTGYTSRADVEAWLKTFHNMTVTKIWENPEALAPNGSLYLKWIAAKNSKPQAHQKTVMAFHGTSREAAQV